MRAAVIQRQGAPVAPNVEFVDNWPDPQPSAGELLVRTEASALNHLDLWVGRGVPGHELEYPRISGSDGCGKVERVGTGVDHSWVGRRVLLNAIQIDESAILPGVEPALAGVGAGARVIGEHTAGAMAEFFVCPAANVLDIGETDPVQAAAFALSHLTAWRMLVTRARLQAGQTVLITGTGGGVALAALTICRHFGCRVIVTSRHEWKLKKARELGAVDGVLDDGADWSRAVRSLTGKRGVDICVDSVGKAIHLSCVKSLARGGVFATCGCTTGPDAVTDLARMFWNQLTFVGSTMGDMNEFRQVVSLLKSGAIEPVIDSVREAKSVRDAYARLESGEQFGKVVVKW